MLYLFVYVLVSYPTISIVVEKWAVPSEVRRVILFGAVVANSEEDTNPDIVHPQPRMLAQCRLSPSSKNDHMRIVELLCPAPMGTRRTVWTPRLLRSLVFFCFS